MPVHITEQLHEPIQDLFHQAISRFPPPHAPKMPLSEPPASGRIGDYLVQLGYLTPRQLERVLYDLKHSAKHKPDLIGCTLVAYDLVPAEVLSAMFLQQFLDRLEIRDDPTPRFIGEELLLRSQLAPAQLAAVLHEQLNAYQNGGWIRVGELIIRHGWLDSLTIQAVLQPER